MLDESSVNIGDEIRVIGEVPFGKVTGKRTTRSGDLVYKVVYDGADYDVDHEVIAESRTTTEAGKGATSPVDRNGRWMPGTVVQVKIVSNVAKKMRGRVLKVVKFARTSYHVTDGVKTYRVPPVYLMETDRPFVSQAMPAAAAAAMAVEDGLPNTHEANRVWSPPFKIGALVTVRPGDASNVNRKFGYKDSRLWVVISSVDKSVIPLGRDVKDYAMCAPLNPDEKFSNGAWGQMLHVDDLVSKPNVRVQ